MADDINSRVGKVENAIGKIELRLDDHEKSIEKQEAKNDEQIELNTLTKMAIKAVEENAKQTKEITHTLVLINGNITNLNKSLAELDGRVSDIESKQNVSLMVILKNIISYIAVGIGGLIFGYFAVKYKIK